MVLLKWMFGFVLVLSLVGCGRMGPLYLPEKSLQAPQPNQQSIYKKKGC